jgi:hypothetical protein
LILPLKLKNDYQSYPPIQTSEYVTKFNSVLVHRIPVIHYIRQSIFEFSIINIWTVFKIIVFLLNKF